MMTETIEIAVATAANPELVEALARLIPQLGPNAPVPTAEEVREIVDSPSTTVLVARDQSDGGRIIGALFLIMFRVGTGLRALIEDVVVDIEARGKGIGEALSREALAIAASRGAATVDLTSRPARGAANRLYQRIGFRRRETNVYRFVFEEGDRDR
jgi:ribosomal protein S18 acetylase RimI-like enzyme